ncbi:MAG TPA: outer membrane beta-barrel protein, partial [Thermoanaerobaculia bacterium]|nr:outer membrane beta-barrel protein [Thermoanaerobaculia bacterium]
IFRYVIVFIVAAAAAAPSIAQTCPAGVVATPKSSTMYLFFPTAADSTFPSYGGKPTSPVNPFTMASHDATISTSAVRNRVQELMRAGFCEFDVDIALTTTVPAPAAGSRWQIVGIGSDNSGVGSTTVGKAQAVDTGDADSQDYCRVWVENIESFCDDQLTGANSTLERWSTAIANLSAHEGAHNYGATHEDSIPRPGEDVRPNHFEADPAAGATKDTISDRLNHFSDTAYERFGHDIGLSTKTLHNWDFVNPNSSSADRLTVTVLSSAATLTIGWFYNGSLSPWTNPTVTKRAGTITFRGTAYNVFDVLFSSPQAWSGGANGVAPAGEKFHVGASFTQPDPIIVYETSLASGATTLALKPRIFGYDDGITNEGGFNVQFFNTGTTELVLSDLEVFFLPRMLDIEEMVVGGALRGVRGEPILPFARRPANENDVLPTRLRQPVRVGKEPFDLPLAKLTDRRHLDYVIKEGECESSTGFGDPRETYCPTPGNVLSLFPATYVYVIATVTEPNAHFWDKAQAKFVDGPLTTRVFFQIAGTVPDANRNDVDDLIDIRNGSSNDNNGNGIPDEAENGGVGGAKGLAAFARIGATLPDTGLSLAAGLEYEFTPQVSAIATIGYDNPDDTDVLRLSLGGRFYFNAVSPLKPYVEAAIGYYDLDPGSSDVAGQAGVGVRYDLSGRLALDAAYHRHLVQNANYSTLQLGLRWRL